jgi:hypothetical protein
MDGRNALTIVAVEDNQDELLIGLAEYVPEYELCVRVALELVNATLLESIQIFHHFYDAASALDHLRRCPRPPDLLILDVQLNKFSHLKNGEAFQRRQNNLLAEIVGRLDKSLGKKLQGQADLLETRAGWFLWSEIERLTIEGRMAPPKRVLVVSGSGKLDPESSVMHAFMSNSGHAEFRVKPDAPWRSYDEFDLDILDGARRRILKDEVRGEALAAVGKALASAETWAEASGALSRDIGGKWCLATLFPRRVRNDAYKAKEAFEQDEGERARAELALLSKRVTEILGGKQQRLWTHRNRVGSAMEALAHPDQNDWLLRNEVVLSQADTFFTKELVKELAAVEDKEFESGFMVALDPVYNYLDSVSNGLWRGGDQPSVRSSLRDTVSMMLASWGKIGPFVDSLLGHNDENPDSVVGVSRFLNEFAQSSGIGFKNMCLERQGWLDAMDGRLWTAMFPGLPLEFDEPREVPEEVWRRLFGTHGLDRVAHVVRAFCEGVVNRFGAGRLFLDAEVDGQTLGILVGHDGERDLRGSEGNEAHAWPLDRFYLGRLAATRSHAGPGAGNLLRWVRRSRGWLRAGLHMDGHSLDLQIMDSTYPTTATRILGLQGEGATTVLSIHLWVCVLGAESTGLSARRADG